MSHERGAQSNEIDGDLLVKGTRRMAMGCPAARIHGDSFSSRKRRMRSTHADEPRRGIATPQRIALLNLRGLHDGLMIEIAILFNLESAWVLHGRLCVDA